MMAELNYDKLRKMIARCTWTFAKTMPFAPHEYIVRDKCPLTDEEFVYLVEMQRNYGRVERWGNYITPYLYIDDYKYWTMGAPKAETTVVNRAKVCVIKEAHQLYEGIEQIKTENKMEKHQYIDEYVHKHLGLKDDDNGYNINLLSGRLDELSACVSHLERIRRNYSYEVMKGWSERLSKDFPDCRIVEDLGPANIVYTGITIPYKDIPDAMTVRIEIAYKSLYYGITYMPEHKDLRQEMQEALSDIITNNDFIKGKDWLYYKYVSFEDGYECLKQLTARMFNYMKDIPLAVRKTAPLPFDIVYLGKYKEKEVYGYAKREDDGSGFGMPYVVLYDGTKAEKMYLFENEELYDKFYKK